MPAAPSVLQLASWQDWHHHLAVSHNHFNITKSHFVASHRDSHSHIRPLAKTHVSDNADLHFAIGNWMSVVADFIEEEVKSLTAKLQLVRCYSSTVHGLDLLFHRYPGKKRVEKTAYLREQLGQHPRPQAP